MDKLGPAVDAAMAKIETKGEEPAKTYPCRDCGVNQVRVSGNGCRDCGLKARARAWRHELLSEIPTAFREASFDAPWLVKLLGPAMIADARAALDTRRVAAVGPPGSGKTSLLAAMLMSLEPMSGRVMWVSAHQLAKARAIHPLGSGEAPLIVAAMDARLLVVDELGGEDARYASAMAEILYERHASAHQTWVSTGVGPKEIADRYGGGIARRVFEDASVFRLSGRRP